MKEKKKILGMTLPLFIIAIVAVGLVSAVLVSYLSNTITAEIEVESPMIAGISLGETTWSGAHFPDEDWNYAWDLTILISGVHGGETITIYTMSENVADIEITGFEKAIVTNPLGVTCGDFESVLIRVDSIYGDLGYGTQHELIGTGGCQELTWNTIQFGSPANSLWSSGEADVSEIIVTFKPEALGTYTFTSQIIPAI